MIPIELELVNFLAYRNPGRLRFDGIHIACLIGPNGAGKSTLLDAITWSLWGKARTHSPDALIHQGQENMRVTLTFEQSQARYRVIRQRQSAKRGTSLLELQSWDSNDQRWQSLSERTMRGTQERIDKLLRLDYETFVNSAFLMQGRADEFTTKTPSQRKQVLANILGLSIWETFERRAKDRISETRQSIQHTEGRLEEIDRELSRRAEYERELSAAENAAKQCSEKLTAAEKEWSNLEKTRNELVSFQKQIDDLSHRIQTSQKEIQEARSEAESLRARSDKQGLQSKAESIRQQLSQMDKAQNEVDKIQKERQKLSAQIANLTGTNQALAPETEPIKDRLSTLQSSQDPSCPTCGQPLTEDHRAQLVSELKSEIQKRRDLYRTNQQKIEGLQSQVQSLDQELSRHHRNLRQRSALEKSAGQLQAALSHSDQAANQVETLMAKINRWEKEQASDQAKRDQLEVKVNQSEKRLRKAALTQEDLDGLRLKKRLADERVGGARQQLAALAALEKQRQKWVANRRQLTENLGLYEDLRQAFGKRGVPSMIIETVVPELERSTNELLSRMSDGRMHVRIETQREIKTGELREALDIIISDELGSRPYEMYSGGEAFRINFAIRIALSRLLARRAGAQLRSLFIDEGFGTQDAQGREHLISAINSIQDDFDRILVITHIDSLKDSFPARIEVRKTPQGSQYRLT